MKIVKPYIDRPFIPTEVDKLVKEKRRTFGGEETMKTASYVGKVPKEVNSKPTIYSTVITSHPTAVIHPVPQPVGYAVHQQTAGAFGTDSRSIQSEISKMRPGAYSVPVSIQGGAINDPTLSGYENPTFISKGEKALPNPPAQQLHPIGHIQNEMKDEIKTFVDQLDNAKDKQERIQICK